MKSIQSRAVALAVLAVLVAGSRAQEPPKPSAEHERLKQLAGEWDAKVKCNFQPGKPEESKGEFTAKVDVGGFFLVTEFKGQMGGQKFQGRGLTGYDPFKKKYVGVWIDSMSPGIFNTDGAFDKSGKVYNETMEGPGPDGKPMKFRATTEIKDKDHMQFQIFIPGEGGKETMMMEIHYTRRK